MARIIGCEPWAVDLVLCWLVAISQHCDRFDSTMGLEWKQVWNRGLPFC